MLNVFGLIPFNFLITFWIDRNFINPFLEARGAGQAVAQVMLFLIPLLDLGTSQAMVKYYAEYRVKEPGRAIMYMQFFVWFHLLLGVGALGALGVLGALAVPETAFAYLSWFVVLNSLAWVPPFFPIFAALFRGQQRFDYAQLETLLFFGMNPALSDDRRDHRPPLGPDASGLRRGHGRGDGLRLRLHRRQLDCSDSSAACSTSGWECGCSRWCSRISIATP